jgi:hypothetical protein
MHQCPPSYLEVAKCSQRSCQDAHCPVPFENDYSLRVNKHIASGRMTDSEANALKSQIRSIIPSECLVNRMYKTTAGGVGVSFQDIASRDTAAISLKSSSLVSLYKITSDVKKEPDVILFGLHELGADEDVVRNLKSKNRCLENASIKVIKRAHNLVIIRVPSTVRKTIMVDMNRRVRLGYSVTRAEDRTSTLICAICSGYGHTSKVCSHRSNPKCGRCSGSHLTAQCNVEDNLICCPNCLVSPVARVKNTAKGHCASDKKCPCALLHRRKEIRLIDFSSGPPPSDWHDISSFNNVSVSDHTRC